MNSIQSNHHVFEEVATSWSRLVRAWGSVGLAILTIIATLLPASTRGAAPPTEGPGGPILVISASSNPFSRYFVEILRAEGLNEFAAMDISLVTSTELNNYDVVILGDMPLAVSQVSMLTDWVNAGGNLIAMRPDKQLSALLGLADTSGTLSNAYLRVYGTGAGAGIVTDSIQFHGVADRYTLNGATALASLYADAATDTLQPAVTLRSVGSNGGHAAAFTFDLARSVVYTRQGNPAWAGQDRAAMATIRAFDLFYGAATFDPQPDWIDQNKVAIPQADEQQRLLANMISQMNLQRKPLPRFWYFPKGKKAVVVMTGDQHGCCDATISRFQQYVAQSPANGSVADWDCVRASSYVFASAAMSDAEAKSWTDQGFELGIHLDTGCSDWTSSSLDSFFTDQLAAFAALFPSIPGQVSHRTHCVVWSDWVSCAEVELAHGVRLDVNYYYYPPGNWTWEPSHPGFFTGSGMPMRFADVDGTMIDVYQATTQMTDESGQSYPFTIDSLLDGAVGPNGYYGVFTANLHTDNPAPYQPSDAVVVSAQARGVPVVSGRQMLEWLDGRNGSSFGSITWSGGVLGFTVVAASGSRNMQAMVPTTSAVGGLTGITLGGSSLAYTTQTIKGVEYAFFAATSGTYQVTYAPDTTPPVISAVTATPGLGGVATIAWKTDEPSDSWVDYGTDSTSLALATSDASLLTTHSITLTGLATSTTYYFRVTSTDAYGNSATSPASPAPPASFNTPSAAFVDTAVADFAAGTPDANTYIAQTADGEVSLNPTVGAEFSGSTLPTGWFTTIWASGGSATVAGGRVFIDEAMIGTTTYYGPGHSLQFITAFNAQNQHVGFGTDLNSPPWAIFSTGPNGPVTARTYDGSTFVDHTIAGNWLGASHRYRIDWTGASVVFSIDGQVVDTQSVAISANMRPLASDANGVGVGGLSIGWMRMSPYPAAGTFMSRVFDAGTTANWGSLAWTSETPTGTTVALSYRTGNTPTPDGSWTAFAPVSTSGGALSGNSRYIQYSAQLATSDPNQTPVLDDATIFYTTAPRTTPPAISAVAAAVGSGGTAAAITWTTDEPADSRVDYGTDPDTLILTASSASIGTSHSIPLTGLTPATTYYYRVTSTDAANNSATSPASPTPPASFVAIDTTPPVISAVAATPGAGGTATITWTTDQPSNSRVDYGTDPNSLTLAASDASVVTSHGIILTGLASSTTYYYRVTSTDAANNSATSPASPAPSASFVSARTTPPVISAATAIAGGGGTATITWTTDEPADSRVDYGTDPDTLNLTAPSAIAVTSHTIPLTRLALATTYYYRVTSTDAANNSATSPASPAPPARFSTPSAMFVDTTFADFGAGTPGANTYIAQTADGEVILNPTAGAEFSGSTLPEGWSSSVSSGGSVTVDGGSLTVDGAIVETTAAYGPGHSLDIVATFNAAQYQHVGFAAGFGFAGWAIFSTGFTTDTLFARTSISGSADTEITPIPGNWIGTAHHYRIEWTATSVIFSIDGTPVVTQYVAIPGSMNPVASDYNPGGPSLSVDWMRLTPYAAAGTFLSRVFDAGSAANWSALSWTSQTPAETTLAMSYRIGNTPAPDGSWTALMPVSTSGSALAGNARYFQYGVQLGTSDPNQTPVLDDVTIGYDLNPDTTPPTITSRSPAPGVTDASTNTSVAASFSEPMDTATITPASFRLRRVGDVADVAATLSSPGATATLIPNSPLFPGGLYQVTIAGTLADVSGNSLGSDVVWTFSTAQPTASQTDTSVADFSAGSPGDCSVVVSQFGDGEVILAPTLNQDFSGTALPADWSSASLGSGSSVTVAGGQVTVDGAGIATTASYGPGASLEFVATFGAANYEHVGFASDVQFDTPFAIFSTKDTTSSLYARTYAPDPNDTLIPGSWLGSPHRYRIDWTASSVVYSIDGVQVASHAVAISASMRPAANDYNVGGPTLSVDWMRMTPYTTPCTFNSRIIDAGQAVTWYKLAWTSLTPAGTTLAMSYRTGNTPTPDGSWTAFTPVSTSGGALAGSSQYIQYAAQLAASDTTQTPVLEDVTVTYILCSPPAITGNPSSATRCVGDPVTFSVIANGDGLTYQWRKGGVNIDGATGSSYTIESVGAGDAGAYDVVVSAACGSPVTSSPATLIVNTAAAITCPANIVVPSAPGECSSNVAFVVTATGNPTPAVECKVGATVITSPYEFPVGTTTVSCTASNEFGVADCSFTVTVHDTTPPAVVFNPISVQLDASGNYTLTPQDVNAIAAGSSDSCGIANMAVTPSSFTVCDAGQKAVTLTVTDVNGNSATSNATITVVAPATPPSVVYVDASYPGSCAAVTFPYSGGTGTNYVGYNAFSTIQAAIAHVAAGGTVTVAAGAYTEIGQIVINNDVSIVGAGKSLTIIKPAQDTSGADDAGAWFLVNSGVNFNLRSVTLDGSNRKIWQAIRHQGSGSIGDCALTNLQYEASGPGYAGTAIAVYGTGNVDVTNDVFDAIGRVGVAPYGASTGTYSGNTYMGKGDGDWLDYAFVIQYGAHVTITNNQISSNLGVASVDGSDSSGIAVWDDPGTEATITGNTLTDNSEGLAIAVWSGGGTDPVVNVGPGNIFTGGAVGVDFQNVSGVTVAHPAVTFGASTFKGQSDYAIGFYTNISVGDIIDISSVVFKDALDNVVNDNFAKEDLVYHVIDAPDRGLLVWNAGNVYVTTNSGSIQRGIDASSASWTVNVSAGSFVENLALNKRLTLTGAGSGNDPAVDTIVTAAAAGTPDVNITASGLSSIDLVAMDNLRLTGASGGGNSGSGIIFASPGSYYAFNNVASVGNSGHGMAVNLGGGGVSNIVVMGCSFSTNGGDGFRVPTAASVDGLTVTGTHFDANSYGLESYMGNGSGSVFQNVNISGSSFNNNTFKGIYVEKLSNAIFSGLTMVNSGFSGLFGAGFNINLKYGDYANIQISDSDFGNCGTGDPANGAGVVIEARGTGNDSSYAARPATLSGVTLLNLNVNGCPDGIRFGEPGKNNVGPTGVTLHDCNLAGNVNNGIRNESQTLTDAVNDWWGSISGPYSLTLNPYGTGSAVSGLVNFSPWLGDSTDTSANTGFQPNSTPTCIPPTHLGFTTQPGGASLGSPLSVQPVLSVLDANDNVTPWANPQVALSIGTNPGGGVLTGTNPQTAVSGVASFSGLAVTVGGGPAYTIVGSAPALASATSDGFDIANPLPALTSLSPYWTRAGGSTFTLTVTGANFVPNSVVKFNGAAQTTAFVNDTTLTASISSGEIASAGQVPVTVVNPAPSGGETTALTFRIENATPGVVYVDDGYVGLLNDTLVNWPYSGTGTHIIGYDAFATIQGGVNSVATNGTVNVAAGTYPEVVVVNRSLTLLGAQAGQSTGTRFVAFATGVNGPKADPSIESVITAAATDPASALNDSVHIMADNVTIDGFVVDGNNPGLPQGGAVAVGGINTDSRRAIETEDASGNLFPVNSALIKNNIIQNYAERGVELANPTDTSPATSGSLITGNVIRNFGLDGILLAFNAYGDVISNTVEMAVGGEAGIWLQDFPSSGALPKTLDWSHNTVTVCQDAFGGIWANLFYASAATINIHDNTVNAGVGVTGNGGLYEHFGIYLSTLQGGTTAHLTDNIVGASGGQFARGIALWNLPTTTTTTVTGGTVSNALKGVSLHYNDPNFEGADASFAANLSGVSISGTDVGVLVDASDSGSDTVQMQISGNTAINGCTTGVSVLGSNASANIHDNTASITGNAIGVDVDAGNALLQNNDLTGNTVAGISVTNNAIVDAGNCRGVDVTGLGVSTGGNNLSGYSFDNLAPWAILNQNSGSTPAVLADHDNFGAVAGDNIRAAFYDPNTAVVYSQTPAVLVAPTNLTVVCASDVPLGAISLAGLYAQGGYYSASSATVSCSDDINLTGSGVITRTYTVTDGCGAQSTASQTITVSDTIPPTIDPLLDLTLSVDPGQSSRSNVIWSVNAHDNCALAGVVSIPPIGSTFTNGTTTVTNIAMDTSGNTATNTFTVTIVDLPQITGQPHSRTNNAGTTATFMVTATSLAPLSYQWFKDNAPLSDGGNISGSTNAMLTITNVSDSDVAQYKAQVSNVAGPVTSDPASLTVIDPPVVTDIVPVSQTNNATTTATFTVSAGGTAPLSYQWTKITPTATNMLSDGGNISGSASNVLAISNVLAADQAEYLVTVSNAAGTATTNGTLVVIDPVIFVQPVSVTNVLGGNVSFNVTAAGTATLKYQWRQNGAGLPGQTASNLVLNAIADSAAGNYSVIVSNLSGSVTSSIATLTITHPPVFSSQPTNLVVNLGGNATFSVSVNGATPFTYQWQKNMVEIPGANNRQFVLNGVTTSDAAAYRVVVSNIDGTATSTNGTLTVIVPPAITSQPLSQTNLAGTTAIFAVTNTGSAATYRWYKNETNLVTDGGKISGSTGTVLTITNVLGADSATYDLVISNAAGVATSGDATLVVIDPIILSQPTSVTTNLGSPAAFTVSAYGTSPQYQWLKNGGIIPGANAATYSIAGVADADQAAYSVVVSNAYGIVTSAPPTTLTVIDPPIITHDPISRTNNAGTTATFTVMVSGTSPTYQWYKNNVALNDTGNISGSSTATLTITNVQDADAAGYKVYVANSAGNQTSSPATLTVIDPPVITQQPTGLTNLAGSTATFTIMATGTSPVYHWLKNGTNVLTDGGKISGSGTLTLTITNILGADDGQYSIIVSNAAGVVTSSNAPLLVIDPYILTQPSSTTNTIGSTVVFSVTAAGTTPFAYQWRWEGFDLFNDTNRTLTLNHISDSDAGSYTVVISNSYGSVTSSPALLVTFPPLIVTQPADFIAIIGQPASFSVDVNGQTPFSYQWQKNGTNITGAVNRVYTINATAYSDAGNYRVIVTNPLGTETSRDAALTVTDLPVLSLVLSNQIPVVTVRWFPGDLCAIDASSNLIDWTALLTNTVPFTLFDTNAPSYMNQFYRARGNP